MCARHNTRLNVADLIECQSYRFCDVHTSTCTQLWCSCQACILSKVPSNEICCHNTRVSQVKCARHGASIVPDCFLSSQARAQQGLLNKIACCFTRSMFTPIPTGPAHSAIHFMGHEPSLCTLPGFHLTHTLLRSLVSV